MPTTKAIARLEANVMPNITRATKKSLRDMRSMIVMQSWLPA